MMRLAADYIHPTPHSGRCRIRIYLPDDERDAPVVICTELPYNEGMSITSAAERIAAEVIRGHRLRTPLVWIEHYAQGARGTLDDPQTFDLVTFSTYEITERAPYLGESRYTIGEPSWKPLTRNMVEALVGDELD